jgi:MoxR-like ATPase
MPGMDGMELQSRIHALNPKIVVIMMTAFASVDTAVRALKQGAFDYVTKPIDPDELSHLVARALKERRLEDENSQLKETIAELSSADFVIGESPAMHKVMEMIRQVAQTNATVMIRGESGTGKELVARTIHANSARKYFPIVPINCGALPDSLLESELFGHEKGAFTGANFRRKGRLEMADGGTLFLDEIGTITSKMQVDLLRAIETNEVMRLGGSRPVHVDFRIICATNEDLEKLVADGRFRQDLYYRINVFSIALPALRERREDIPTLARHFMGKLAMEMDKRVSDISPEANQKAHGLRLARQRARAGQRHRTRHGGQPHRHHPSRGSALRRARGAGHSHARQRFPGRHGEGPHRGHPRENALEHHPGRRPAADRSRHAVQQDQALRPATCRGWRDRRKRFQTDVSGRPCRWFSSSPSACRANRPCSITSARRSAAPSPRP